MKTEKVVSQRQNLHRNLFHLLAIFMFLLLDASAVRFLRLAKTETHFAYRVADTLL